MPSKICSNSLAAFAAIFLAIPFDQRSEPNPFRQAEAQQPVETIVVSPPAAVLWEFIATVRVLDLEAVAVPEVVAPPLQPVAFAFELSPSRTVAAAPHTAPAAPPKRMEPVVPATLARRSVPGISVHSRFESTAEEFPGALAVAVPRLAADGKWRRVLQDVPVHESTPAWQRWDELVQRISGLSGEERLQAANEGINHLISYATDQSIYGVSDYWATLDETISRGAGDCEDIAIAKMWLLNAAGVDLSSMRLVVLKDTLRNLDHAVLSVVENGHQYILDNAARSIGHAPWMRGYRPIYALSSEQSWIYGMRTPVALPIQVAQSSSPTLPQ